MEYKSKLEEEEWLKNGFVGTVHKAEDIMGLQEKLMEAGIYSISTRYMGGKKVFIGINENENMAELLKEEETTLRKWFSSIVKWSPDQIAKERYCWICIHGIPLHAWREDFFKLITIKFGTYMHPDASTTYKDRLDMARVLIRTTSMSTINSIFKVKIDEKLFLIRLTEDVLTHPFAAQGYLSKSEKHILMENESISGSEETLVPESCDEVDGREAAEAQREWEEFDRQGCKIGDDDDVASRCVVTDKGGVVTTHAEKELNDVPQFFEKVDVEPSEMSRKNVFNKCGDKDKPITTTFEDKQLNSNTNPHPLEAETVNHDLHHELMTCGKDMNTSQMGEINNVEKTGVVLIEAEDNGAQMKEAQVGETNVGPCGTQLITEYQTQLNVALEAQYRTQENLSNQIIITILQRPTMESINCNM
jgi:hypothetical protein